MTPSPVRPSKVPARSYLTPAQARDVFSWSRFMIVLVLLLTQLLTLLGLLWVNRTTSHQALRSQARSSLTQLVRVTADNTRAYLQGASDTVQLMRATLGQTSAGTPEQYVRTLHGVLNSVAQVDGAMIARDDGQFTFVRNGQGEADRQEADRQFVRIVEVQPTRRVTDARIDAAGQISGRQVVDTAFDPRTRPWFERAVATPGKTVWTDPYVFATSRLPGITVASTVEASRASPWQVVAVDVQLSGLSTLLQGLQVSTHGRAFITDGHGHAIAASRAWPNDVQDHIPNLQEVGDPPLQQLLAGRQALNAAPGDSPLQLFTVNGERYAAVLQLLEIAPGMHWTVGVYAPEADFTSELQETYRRQLWAIVLFTLFSGLLAWPLAFRATQPLAFLQRQATTDSLTGLVNRASFLGYLQEELRQAPFANREVGVVMLDLDGFKAVNDSFGHGTGDEVLHAVGARLLGSVRAGDTLGRLGGDEFALILKGETREGIRLRIEGIIHELTHRPIVVEGQAHALGATAGLAFYHLATRQTGDDLLARADQALMQGKRLEKGRVWVEGEGRKTIFD